MLHNTTGTRSYAAFDLLTPMIKKQKNITVIDNALALKVLTCKSHGTLKAKGVEYQKGAFSYKANTQFTPNHATPKKIFAKREVILCGGAINTPQIMMLSGLGPKDHLESLGIPVLVDLPGVGSNLQDHLEVFVNFRFAKPFYFASDTINALDLVNPNDPAYQNFLISGRGPYDAVGDIGVLEWFSGVGPKNPLKPDLHIQFKNAYFQDFNINDWIATVDPTFSYAGFVIEVAHPVAPYGTIRLRSSNPHDTPIIDENLANTHNAKVLANGIIIARNLYNQPFNNYGVPTTVAQRYQATEVGPLAAVPSNVPALVKYIKRNSAFGHHISCTCRMGKKDDPLAVTDSKLRVRGIPNLRIVDASIFPNIPGGNTCVPVYMVAEKASDEIKKEHHLH
jgi:choline dehydrogenase